MYRVYYSRGVIVHNTLTIIRWDGSHVKENTMNIQQLWQETMEELGLLDSIVASFDSVGQEL